MAQRNYTITPFRNGDAINELTTRGTVDTHDSADLGVALHEALDLASTEVTDTDDLELRVSFG